MLNRDVGDIVLDSVILAVLLRVEGGVPVGKGVIVTDLVAGLLGVRVIVLCGDLLTLGVLVRVALTDLLEVAVTEEVGVGDGSI